MALNDTNSVVVDAGKYSEAGLFRRIVMMAKGLSRPRASRDYKEAVIELERLSAPLTALLLPTLAVIVLAVVSAVGGNKREDTTVIIAHADETEDDPIPVDLPQVPEDPDVPPPIDTQVVTDVPAIKTPTEIVQSTTSNQPDTQKLSTLESVQQVNSPVSLKNMFGDSRRPGKPGYLDGSPKYGDKSTEGAVLKALRWLKHTQNSDGSWNGPSKPAMTGFAVLTYLAHGEKPMQSREFGDTVKRALEFLVDSVEYDGEGKRVTGMKGMDGNQYAFPIATYALAEAYGMTHNPNIKAAAEKCLARIIESQSSTGGWDYKLAKSSNRDDTSLGGWCIQAVKAGKMAGLHPDGLDNCIKKSISCLTTRAYNKQLGFKYTADSNGGGGLAGVGCLAMQLLGYGARPEVRNALDVMCDWLPSFENIPGCGTSPQYYCYYASQCKYQAGMAKSATRKDSDLWKKWNREMKKLYPPSIITLDEKIEDANGRLQEMGYWQNKDQHVGDRTMGTCLTALQLMVYYRYLPTTTLKATEIEVDINEAAKDASDVKVNVDI